VNWHNLSNLRWKRLDSKRGSNINTVSNLSNLSNHFRYMHARACVCVPLHRITEIGGWVGQVGQPVGSEPQGERS